MPHWEKVKEMSPMTIDIPSDIMVDGYMSSWKGIYPEVYNNSYFSLVTSTSFDTPWTHPDEKFWKPLGQFPAWRLHKKSYFVCQFLSPTEMDLI